MFRLASNVIASGTNMNNYIKKNCSCDPCADCVKKCILTRQYQERKHRQSDLQQQQRQQRYNSCYIGYRQS
ncbi:orf22 [Artaxa digramma nucleopolyhedrovirus]|uniref:Orf22 n=1 Tax=Artaxa digramma nucleopolyhedrovirus TaxID=3070910 RepID=A0AAE6UZG1_9ABAC|nr:orf22 [Euproctis digramma nucleopolyhedrovirus]QHB21681.1 orf22 [Artaxa digramma nucleopolyhedrovirus]